MDTLLIRLQLMAPNIMLGLSMILVIILSFINCKKHGLTKRSTLLFILAGYTLGVGCAMLMGDLYTLVAKMFDGGGSRLAIFGVVASLPFILVVFSLLSGTSWRGVNDLFAPGAFLGLAFSKFGCFIYGCCPGIECDFGVYNRIHDKIMFPSQLFESITMILVVGFSFWYNYKYKKKIPGTAYPVTAIAYTVTRFIWEFWRYYDIEEMKHLLFGLSFWQIWCVIVFVISVIWIVIAKNPKLPEKEERFYAWRKKQVQKLRERLSGNKKPENIGA